MNTDPTAMAERAPDLSDRAALMAVDDLADLEALAFDGGEDPEGDEAPFRCGCADCRALRGGAGAAR